MNRMTSFFNSEYLLVVPSSSKYEIFFLGLALTILLVVITARTFFFFKKRSEAYLDFDKRWFWGYLIIAFWGLFVWFSRDQELPTFGTRLASYSWLAIIFFYLAYLVFYYKKEVKKSIRSHHDKERKEKYLKR